MPETRRELFRTSVVGALGLTAGVVVGYAAAGGFVSSLSTPYAGLTVAVHDNGGKWYFFHFEDASHCRLYKADCVPPISDVSAVDTATWFAVSKKTLITTNTKITYTPNTGALPASIQVNIGGDGYLDQTSLNNVVLLLGPKPPIISGSWNEIGRA